MPWGKCDQGTRIGVRRGGSSQSWQCQDLESFWYGNSSQSGSKFVHIFTNFICILYACLRSSLLLSFSFCNFLLQDYSLLLLSNKNMDQLYSSIYHHKTNGDLSDQLVFTQYPLRPRVTQLRQLNLTYATQQYLRNSTENMQINTTHISYMKMRLS